MSASPFQKALLCLMAYLGASSVAVAQAAFTNPIPPSPESAKIAQFSLSPPNLYTGAFSTSLPLYSFDFDGKQVSLSLSYHGSGIRVAEESGNVGLGWAVSTPGSVHRSVKGFDDLGKYPNRDFTGHLNDYTPIPTTWTQTWWDQYLVGPKKDTEPDIFSYSFLNSSGKFFLKKKANSSSPVEVIKLKPNADKIVFNETTATITITDPEGFQGIFSVKEYSTSVSGGCQNSWSTCYENNIVMLDVLKSGGRAINTWHLSKIISPRGRELVFNYDINQITSFSDYLTISQPSWQEQNSVESSVQLTTENSQSFSRVINEQIYLTSITSTDLDLKVQFNYQVRTDIQKFGGILPHSQWLSSINNHDRPGHTGSVKDPQRLASIHVSNLNSNTLLNYQVTFTQSYFNSASDVNTGRLRLDNVVIGDQKYRFLYENGNGIPAKNSKGIDYWGYYNGRNSNTTLAPVIQTSPLWGFNDLLRLNDQYFYQSPSRAADFSYGKAGLLKEIVYPTGGRSVVEYESHEYNRQGSMEVPAPTQVGQIIHGRDENKTYSIYHRGLGNGGCGSVLDITLTVRCGGYCNPAYPPHYCYPGPQPTCDLSMPYSDYYKVAAEIISPSGQIVHQLFFGELWVNNVNFYQISRPYPKTQSEYFFPETGVFTIKVYGITVGGVSQYYGSASISTSDICSTPPGTNTSTNFRQQAGGARVKSLTLYDENMNMVERKRYEYDVYNPYPSGQSSGELVNPLSQFSAMVHNSTTQSMFYFYTSGSALENGNAAQGSHIGYKEVRVHSDGKNGAYNGYEHYNFVHQRNEYIPFNQSNVLEGTRFLTFEDQNGQPELSYVTNSNNALVESNNPTFAKIEDHTYNAIKLNYVFGNSRPMSTFYNFKSDGWVLDSKVTNKETFQTQESFQYNPFGQIKKISTTNSDGKAVVVNKRYPLDITSPTGIISTLQSKNVVGSPFETQETVNGATVSATGLLHKTATVNGATTPVISKIYGFNTEGTFTSSSGTSFTGGYFEAKDLVNYDAKGNPTEILDELQKRSALIWGYNSVYPVAITENASAAQIAYTSFETNETGGWTYSGAPVSSATDSRTGRRYYNLSTGAISKSSLPAGTYRLSFWARTASGTTNWSFLGITETLSTTWKLVERTVTGSVSIPTASIWIDELRLHPATSLMTTSTYDMMVGATSVTDPSNKTTYYEYDLLGRLIRIKDQDGHILKQFQYSYANPN